MKKASERVQDPISELIRSAGVKIESIVAARQQDVLIVALSNGVVFNFPLSGFSRLADASQTKLDKWKLLPDGAGVHWPDLDEHLSLRGFMLAQLKGMMNARMFFAAAHSRAGKRPQHA